jgi:hypothetical protein
VELEHEKPQTETLKATELSSNRHAEATDTLKQNRRSEVRADTAKRNELNNFRRYFGEISRRR